MTEQSNRTISKFRVRQMCKYLGSFGRCAVLTQVGDAQRFFVVSADWQELLDEHSTLEVEAELQCLEVELIEKLSFWSRDHSPLDMTTVKEACEHFLC